MEGIIAEIKSLATELKREDVLSTIDSATVDDLGALVSLKEELEIAKRQFQAIEKQMETKKVEPKKKSLFATKVQVKKPVLQPKANDFVPTFPMPSPDGDEVPQSAFDQPSMMGAVERKARIEQYEPNDLRSLTRRTASFEINGDRATIGPGSLVRFARANDVIVVYKACGIVALFDGMGVKQVTMDGEGDLDNMIIFNPVRNTFLVEFDGVSLPWDAFTSWSAGVIAGKASFLRSSRSASEPVELVATMYRPRSVQPQPRVQGRRFAGRGARFTASRQ